MERSVRAWADRMMPLAAEVVALQVDRSFADVAPTGSPDPPRSWRDRQVHSMSHQWLAAPVLGDVAEESRATIRSLQWNCCMSPPEGK